MHFWKFNRTFVGRLQRIKFYNMENIIKIRKFVFTESQPTLTLSKDEMAEFIDRKYLKIDLIEVDEMKNPSDLIVVITREGISTSTTPFYLYKHRTKFIYQEGKFILDTQGIEVLSVAVGGNKFDIKIVAEEGISKFRVEMYYSIV